jgi:uncharacterized membrane protein YagU involved in acid resistance
VERMSSGLESRGASLRTPVVTGWLVAGTVDIVIAVVYYPLTTNVKRIQILQGIASGLLGQRAFSGGLATAGIGLACHYCIAFLWTGFFFLVYPRMAILTRSRLLTSALYGTFVSVVMSFVVLPLSRVTTRPFNLRFFAIATVILMFSIGLPLSIVAGRHYARPAVRR